MPFKSRAQMEKFEKMEREGKLPPGTTAKWAAETADISKLPTKIVPAKARSLTIPTLGAKRARQKVLK